MTGRVYILCAALYLGDGKPYVHQPKNIDSGIVVCGRRHHNCFAILYGLLGLDGYDRSLIVQGFVTSDDRFVGREEAAQIAFAAGQIAKETNILMSEDLY